jgi:hypothetical protein
MTIPPNVQSFMDGLVLRGLTSEQIQQELITALSQSLSATDRYCVESSRHQAEASWFRRESQRLERELAEAKKPWWARIWPGEAA